MILDFNAMAANAVPHFKGGEGEAIVRKFDDPRMGAGAGRYPGKRKAGVLRE